jgi:hypothetical protein|tara:strand:+ start:428 stop:868 length:441 start_codon:yes stop_codon:yes gene_type:complete
MKITIIREDKTVVKDGVGIAGLTLSSVPSDVWAVQWDSTTSTGTVEKNDLSVETITSLGIYQSCVDEFDTKKTELETPPTLTTDEEWANLRIIRTSLLSESDWTQLSDSQLSSTKKTEWATYRQTLRDLPANTSDPAKPTWPTKPS